MKSWREKTSPASKACNKTHNTPKQASSHNHSEVYNRVELDEDKVLQLLFKKEKTRFKTQMLHESALRH